MMPSRRLATTITASFFLLYFTVFGTVEASSSLRGGNHVISRRMGHANTLVSPDPTDLVATKVEADTVEIQWNWGTGAIAGHYIWRNGKNIATNQYDKTYKDDS
eukprot:13243510-Ditylum_brightwellii.AAC.1